MLSGRQAAAFDFVLQAEAGASLEVPGGHLLLVASFERAGADLLLIGPDGTRILI